MEMQEENFELNENEEQSGTFENEIVPDENIPEVTGDPSENIKVDNVNSEAEDVGYANVDDLLGQIDDKTDEPVNEDVVDNDLNTDDKAMGIDDGDEFLK